MLSFFILGCIVTATAVALFLQGLLTEGLFLFGPFIAGLIGLNFLFISFVQVKREREVREGRKPS
ncbi:hypothetical protein JCM9140_1316 [Halalkalibacter wakoensis JCM 9140]|uniref:Uncharacterized protein n=1 Tax=Halalkalibacter wakoensis JCM 9140 TaxID=1236970 RepID=W4Q006_9BACI|nr:hypothetical protein [Halalkalibacter wakoensis]GAE25327.1 hypothetical protein JCM9140_1316 [Halalkalibacter wakoensis JCM 9140]